MREAILMSAAVAAMAGSVYGQMSYDVSRVRLQHSVSATEGDQSASTRDRFLGAPGDLTALTTRTHFGSTIDLDANPFPSIASVSSSLSSYVQASASRFEFSWDFSTNGALSAPLDPSNDSAGSSFAGFARMDIAFTEDTLIRIRIAGIGSDFAISDTNGGSFTVGEDPNSPIVPLAYSAGEPDNAFDLPLDFEFGVEAGDVLDVDFIFQVSTFTDEFPTTWDRSQAGHIIIEVVPTPASAAVLACGGLLATRRRR